jgi:pimeloyl-ACP methyl ester carboxylesterase
MGNSLEALTHLLSPGRDSDYGAAGRSEWLDVDWSEHVHRVPIRGREVEYADIGRGEQTILWIHGLGACWQTWLENLPHFARGYRNLALDLPGFGRSEMPSQDISIERYAEIVQDFMDELGVDRAIVVGNSMGGFIGSELAIRYPERVDRLVLVSAAVFWQEYRRARPLIAFAQATETAAGRALVGGTPAIVRRPRARAAALAFGGFRYPHRIPRELQVEVLLTAKRTAGFVPALAALGNYPLREELPRIQCPTMVVWGTDDTLVSVKHAHELEALIPNSTKVIFERTGHVPMLERPARFNRVVEEWLSEPASAGDGALGGAADQLGVLGEHA